MPIEGSLLGKGSEGSCYDSEREEGTSQGEIIKQVKERTVPRYVPLVRTLPCMQCTQ